MESIFSISPMTTVMIGVGGLALLEILFLFARIIENEKALHNLKVRSHTLRMNMVREAAMQMVHEWEYEQERTGKNWAEIINLKNKILDPVLQGEVGDDLTSVHEDDREDAKLAA